MTRAIEAWADVGGTFTDCFLVEGNVRRSLKVLSSGRVRVAIVGVAGPRVTVDPTLDDVDDFWVGAEVEVLGVTPADPPPEASTTSSESRPFRVLGFTRASHTLVLDQPLPESLVGGVLDLDGGLESPVLAIRRMLSCPLGEPLPPVDLRLGTTRGTNALLTRRGARVALVTTRGFGDLLEIGEQTRPDLFALAIHKPEPLTRQVIEVDQRMDSHGAVLRELDEAAVTESLRQLQAQGVTSLAICLLHSHINDAHERQIARLAEGLGFEHISVSSRIAPLIKLVARAETTVLDAYLNPILQSYIRRIREQLGHFRDQNAGSGSHPAARLRLMTSAGNLVAAESFRGCDSILSGPAGGVVSLGKIAAAYQAPAAIGLDMGGTSTDVSRFEGQVARQYESRKAGVRVLTPMIAIHTVAAGGGSICDYVDGRMMVGPQSAGADPGPACYGKGGPLTVTDLNVFLGRLPSDHFPFPLDLAAAERRLAEVNAKLGADAFATLAQAAEGFLKIAVTHMAEAVRTVSTAQGSDPRGMTLVGFGGAAGGHLCGIADEIGMARLIDHRDASLLSALGMGLADIGRVRGVGVYRRWDELDAGFWQQTCETLRREVCRELREELHGPAIADAGSANDSAPELPAAVRIRFEADLRYQGVEAALSLPIEPQDTLPERFHQAHQDAFGYDQRQRAVEVAVVRCEAVLPSVAELDPPAAVRDAASVAPPAGERNASERPGGESVAGSVGREADGPALPVHERSSIASGTRLDGPCIVIDDNSTLVVDRGWVATKLPGNSFELTRSSIQSGWPAETVPVAVADPVMVEVVARRFQGIADEMGELLRRTAVSVNVKERLDYSCAVFDAQGTLLANAPHVPVHLGAMGHTVRHLLQAYPQMSPGDVYLSNDPYAGGSHLPDVTLVTPVFCDTTAVAAAGGRPDFFVASRAHHAEIGGKTPGLNASRRDELGRRRGPDQLVRAASRGAGLRGRAVGVVDRRRVSVAFARAQSGRHRGPTRGRCGGSQAGDRAGPAVGPGLGRSLRHADAAAGQRRRRQLDRHAGNRAARLRRSARRRYADRGPFDAAGGPADDRFYRHRRRSPAMLQRPTSDLDRRDAVHHPLPDRRDVADERGDHIADRLRASRRLAQPAAGRDAGHQPGGGRGECRDQHAVGRRAAGRARRRGRQPGDDEQRADRRRHVRLLRDDRRRLGGDPGRGRGQRRALPHDQHADHRSRNLRIAISGSPLAIRDS